MDLKGYNKDDDDVDYWNFKAQHFGIATPTILPHSLKSVAAIMRVFMQKQHLLTEDLMQWHPICKRFCLGLS